MALFESYERRIDKINSVLNRYGIASIEEAEKITKDAGLNVYDQIKGIQPICFENAVSYTHLFQILPVYLKAPTYRANPLCRALQWRLPELQPEYPK